MIISIAREFQAMSAPTRAISANNWNGCRCPDVISFALQNRQLLTIRKPVKRIRPSHTSEVQAL